MKHSKSNSLFEEAQKLIPGGVNSPVRAFKSVGISPVFIEKGEGCRVTDVDDNVYIDYICSWGPLLLGHSSEVILDGVNDYLLKGSSYGVPTSIEIEVAKLINEAFPSMEMIRMVNSGTEATMSALRAARGYTNRDKILKFEGCYHGHSDNLLVKSGSGALTFGKPTSSGVPEDTVKNTLVGEFNNIELLREIFKNNKGEIAAVIVEPIPGNMGLVPPDVEFLREIRKITEEENTVLIFDEVISGFRVDFGGAQKLYDIKPDMTCLGKIIGGGMPVGAYGGKREIMEMIAPLGPVYQAGTLSGNPVAMKMGYNALNYLKHHKEVYTELEEKAIMLEKGFMENIKNTGVKASVNRVKGMICLFFNETEVRSYSDVMKSNIDVYAKYFKSMLEQGILLPPAQFECMFLSAAHTEQAINETIKANYNALKSIAN